MGFVEMCIPWYEYSPARQRLARAVMSLFPPEIQPLITHRETDRAGKLIEKCQITSDGELFFTLEQRRGLDNPLPESIVIDIPPIDTSLIIERRRNRVFIEGMNKGRYFGKNSVGAFMHAKNMLTVLRGLPERMRR